MKYFTRARYLALQNVGVQNAADETVDPDNEALDAADADWDAAVEAYDAHLQTLRPDLPASVRQLLDGFYLHDARVLSIGQRGETFVISLRLDVPPNDLLAIIYTLADQVEVTQDVFPWVKNTDVADWLYDEIESANGAPQVYYLHSIFLSNGWELRIPFRDVHVTTTSPLLPHPNESSPHVHPWVQSV